MKEKPCIRFWNGRWYVHPDRDTSFAIASGKTVREAWANYQLIEYEIECRKALVTAGRSGKFNMNVIFTVLRRLRGKA